jgi:spermidine synthase
VREGPDGRSRAPAAGAMIRAAALLLTALTGFSALVYEVAWQKYLATLLGSHAEATAAVLAIFLGGLSAGYALFGRLTHRVVGAARRRGRAPSLLALYGAVEASIGAWAFLFPFLFGLAQRLSLLLPQASKTLAFAFDVGLAALLLGPPALLMGGTIPVLTLALAGSLDAATRVHAWIYGLNTAGAFAGALAAAFTLVPTLGLDGAIYAMGVVNLFAGVAFLLLDRRVASVVPDLAAVAEPAVPIARLRAVAAIALLAGFAAMALQTTLIRIGGLALGASNFTFAMVVAVFVACIAIGSIAVSALPRIPRWLVAAALWALVAALLLLYRELPDATYWAHRLRTRFASSADAFIPFHLCAFAAAFAVLALPIGLSGALLPLLFHALRREVGDLGSVAGRLYGWNTAGSLLGALLGGYLLLFWLDLHHVYRVAVGALAVGAAIASLLVPGARSRALACLALAATLGALWSLPAWDPMRLAAGLFRQREPIPGTGEGPNALFAARDRRRLLFYDDDPTSSVAVMEIDAGQGRSSRQVVVNGKSDGNLVGDYPNMALTALLPAFLAEKRDRCFVIGWGTGVTAGELAALADTREIAVAEISRGVIRSAPLFDAGNLGASKSPKVEIRRGDAYRTLLRSDERWDLIVSEPSNPWVTGVEMLYSRDFLEAARRHLAPGGIYAQWFHLYELDQDSVELVLRTTASVFPEVSVWFTMSTDLLLLAMDRPGPAFHMAKLRDRLHRPDFAVGFGLVGIRSLPALFAHELLPFGSVHAMRLTGPLHTLRNPILSDRAARAFFLGGTAQLPRYVRPPDDGAAARSSLLRRLAAEPDGSLPEPILAAVIRETCRTERIFECATLLALGQHQNPGSSRLSKQLARWRASPAVAGVLGAGYLDLLASLFPGAPRSGREDAIPEAQVVRATEAFLRHYHHLAPFDRGALEDLWSRCEGPGCAGGRRWAESVLGPLPGPRSPRGG